MPEKIELELNEGELKIAASDQPQFSAAAIESYREAMAGWERVLHDPASSPALLEQARVMQKTIRDGLAVTGQSLEPEPDPRSPAQIFYDKQHALSPDPDEHLQRAIDRDVRGRTDPDPSAKKWIEAVGRDFTKTLELAQETLPGVPVERLSAETLLSVVVWAEWKEKHAAKRPKQ